MAIPGLPGSLNGQQVIRSYQATHPFSLLGTSVNPAPGSFRWDTRSARTKNPPDIYGWRNPAPYQREFGRCYFPQGVATVQGTGERREYSGSLGTTEFSYGPTTPARYEASYPTAKQTDLALLKVREKMKGQKVNLAQAFNERRQTANLISSTMTSVAKSLKALKKGDLHGAARALGLKKHKWRSKPKSRSTAAGSPADKRVSNRWLELQYGWKPLLSDVHGAVEALQARDNSSLQRYVVTFKGAHSQGDSLMFDESIYGVTRLQIHQDHRQSVRLRFDMIPDNTFYQTLGSLGVTNPATLLWESLPWSFAIDWFLPIGSFINQFDAGMGWKFKAGVKSEYGFSSVYWLPFNRKERYYVHLKAYPYAGHMWSKRIRRSVYSSLPSVTAPRFKNPFSGLHVANALALLNGLRR